MITCTDGIITVEDLGVTLRTLLAVAADHAVQGKRVYKVSYKRVVIGSVRIRGVDNASETSKLSHRSTIRRSDKVQCA